MATWVNPGCPVHRWGAQWAAMTVHRAPLPSSAVEHHDLTMKDMRLTVVGTLCVATLLITNLVTHSYLSAAAIEQARHTVYPATQASFQEIATNQLIVKYNGQSRPFGISRQAAVDPVGLLSATAGMTLEYVRDLTGDAHVLRLPLRLPVAEVEVIAERIAALPGVAYAEPDRLMFPALAPNDDSYPAQWHYFETHGINAPPAWEITTGSGHVKIAIIDSGITDHPDLAGRWVGGYDFITYVPFANDGDGRDGDPHDPGDWVTGAEAAAGPFAGCPVTHSTWHGTHIAGTVAAASNNGIGVAGVNWVAQFVPVRVTGKCGGYISDIADGMRWAAGLPVAGAPENGHPAKVLNVSVGGIGQCSPTYQSAIDAINAAGAIIVVAANNFASNLDFNTFQPANCNGVITVAATDRDGDKALYSNYGRIVKISAPGGETFTSSPGPAPQNGILSTRNAGLTTPGEHTYGYAQGTSMAAPHVAGVVSLMVSLDASLNLTRSLQILQSTARPFPAGSFCNPSRCGSGIVDAAAALGAIGTPPATVTPSPTESVTPGPPTATSTLAPTVPPTLETPTPRHFVYLPVVR